VFAAKRKRKNYLSPRRQDAKKNEELSEFRILNFRTSSLVLPWRLGVLARDIPV
jgi:hypothetical protein